MSQRLIRVFSGSCLSLDDGDQQLPVLEGRQHVLGSGVDMYDTEHGVFVQPRPKKLTKIFSGSELDLNAAAIGMTPVNSPPLPGPNEAQQGTSSGHFTLAGNASSNELTQVVVIGAGGYLGGHIVNQLLRAGYTVRATVVDTNDQSVVEDLYVANHETRGRLAVVQADIFNAQSLRSAISGCQTIIHCGVGATRVTADGNADVLSIHMTAIQAFFSALTAGRAAASRRVILTGSYVATIDPSTGSRLVNEDSWNPSLREVDPNAHARVQFEREAWRLGRLCGIDLVVMLPSILLGPGRTNTVSEAMAMIAQQANGSPLFPFAANLYWNFVDVRDAAKAYVSAVENGAAVGNRFLLSTRCCNLAEIGRIIRQTHPHLSPPTMTLPSLLTLACGPFSGSNVTLRHLWRTLGVRRAVDGSRAVKQLDLTPIAFEMTVNDAVSDLIDMGHVPQNDENRPQASKAGKLVATAVALGAIVTVASLGLRVIQQRNSRK